MRPSVSVPVLSVKSTWMFPKSSMATRRRTRTDLVAIRFAPVERLIVTMAGSSSGVMPTATASENRTASMNGRPIARFTIRIPTTRTAVMRTSSLPKSRRPRWKEVSGGRSPSSVAIRPNSVSGPVRTTTARAVPDFTTVPMNAHEGRSIGEDGR